RVSYDTMAWAISGYLASTAVFQVCAGSLADRFGRRSVLTCSLCIFLAASIGCAVSESYLAFLAFRILQGSVVSGMVLSRAIVSDLFDRKRTAGIIGYIAMAMSVAPIIGPSVGGYLGEIAGWRAIFLVYFLSGISLLALVHFQIPETGGGVKHSEGSAFRSLLELLSDPRFLGYTSIMTLSTATFYIFITGLPLVASEQFMMTQAQIGLGMGSITVGFLIGSLLSGRLLESCSLHAVLLSGRLAATLGLTVCVCALWSGWETPMVLFGCTSLVGLGNGLTMPGASAAAMFVRKDLAASASGLSDAVIVTAGAVVTAVTGYVAKAFPDAMALVGLMLPAAAGSLAISAWMSFNAQERIADN
ncbi:MAG: multidrug effflux MFS transporter, partial [Boseongicola sp. SB0662_bin_57]|nr:multidrug effflux MFS transporter [Boseongicola sp. SB0662_bin_57]